MTPSVEVDASRVPIRTRSIPSAATTLFLAGLSAGVLDILYVIVFYAVREIPAMRVLQGVAAGLVGGPSAVKGGAATAALGLGLHFVIAFAAAAVFYAASRKFRVLVQRPLISGFVYGVAVWLFMNLVVLPLSATPPKTFPGSTWVAILLAHIFCVGLPIALIVAWRERRSLSARG